TSKVNGYNKAIQALKRWCDSDHTLAETQLISNVLIFNITYFKPEETYFINSLTEIIYFYFL
ncbi:MAG: hypothetical protein U9N34_00085, partial [Candidatus Cloacimonadota bacterium]|nr:hypothetical protein [Candidatus Cloacimonadota bacterium]